MCHPNYIYLGFYNPGYYLMSTEQVSSHEFILLGQHTEQLKIESIGTKSNEFYITRKIIFFFF